MIVRTMLTIIIDENGAKIFTLVPSYLKSPNKLPNHVILLRNKITMPRNIINKPKIIKVLPIDIYGFKITLIIVTISIISREPS